MALNIRFDGDLAILSNFARLMNDPRYTSARDDVDDLLDRGYSRFILELSDVREAGSPFFGLLVTLTRQVRQEGGDVVLARISRAVGRFIEEMQMDDFWDVYPSVEEAARAIGRGEGPDDDDDDDQTPDGDI